MNVTMSHGSALIQSALRVTHDVARRFGRGDLSELPRDLVTLSRQEDAVKVGAALIRTSDEMTGTLLDILA